MDGALDLSLWQEEGLKTLWGGGLNYKILNGQSSNNKCAVFFSSNGLYYPNNIEAAVAAVNNDKFDWKNLIQHKYIKKEFKKIILLRDIYKQWYITGISSEIDSIDKLAAFLLRETEGYEVYTVGSSAGGYAAALLGAKLNAKAAYCFSAQFSIWDQIQKAPFIQKYKDDESRSRYFDIRDIVEQNSTVKYFYFYPAHCEWDIVQRELIANSNTVIPFAFNENVHGSTMFSGNIPFVITMDPLKLEEISKQVEGKILNRKDFLFMTVGRMKGYWVLCDRVIRKVFKR